MKREMQKWICMFLTVAMVFGSIQFPAHAAPVEQPGDTQTLLDVQDENGQDVSEEGEDTTVQDSDEDSSEGSGQNPDLTGELEDVQSVDEEPEIPTSEEESEVPASEEEPEITVLEEESETPKPYENYWYGDPAYSGNYVYGKDADGNDVMEYYEDDLDEIIRMAEEGLDLSSFFRSTQFSKMSLEDLYTLKEAGIGLKEAATYYYYNSDKLPEAVRTVMDGAFAQTAAPVKRMMRAASRASTTLTSQGIRRISGGDIGVFEELGKDKAHGPVVKLQTNISKGYSIGDAFCGKYGGSYSSGYSYSEVADPTTLIRPDGGTLTQGQIEIIRFIVATYTKTTYKSDGDYAGAQVAIWYCINNPSIRPEEFFWAGWWADGTMQGPLEQAAQRISGGRGTSVYNGIRAFIVSVQNMYDRVTDITDFSSVGIDIYPGQAPTLHFWVNGNSNAQWIITWSMDVEPTPPTGAYIPTVNNYYVEKEATTKYNIELTKESVITNELLEGVQFRVDEQDAGESDLDYIVKTGANAGMGTEDYENATIFTFGNHTDITDPVPYMDDDIEPSNGAHTTVITTDENGHASTTFVHKHTFKEYWSQCMDGNGNPIPYETYVAVWEGVLEMAEEAEETGDTVSITYLGETKNMLPDEIKSIYNGQQIVYTQTQDEAMATINDRYNRYKARTYQYEVTELTPYTRNGAMDSNGNVLDTIVLPKDGYRMNVQDVTTMGTYVKVLHDGETMVPGGTNDKDGNTAEKNVTNEPWYNQIFINKVDLETNSQILYDTYFDIYEYYQYLVTLTPAVKLIYPAEIISAYRDENGYSIIPKTISSATLKVYPKGSNTADTTIDIDEAQLIAAMEGDSRSYGIDYSTTYSGESRIEIEVTVDTTLDTDSLGSRVLTGAGTEELTCNCTGMDCDPDCVFCSMTNKEYCKAENPDAENCRITIFHGIENASEIVSSTGTDDAGNLIFTTTNGYSYVLEQQIDMDEATGKINSAEEVYTRNDGKVFTKTGGAYLSTTVMGGKEISIFQYKVPATDVYLLTHEDGSQEYVSTDGRAYISHEADTEADTLLLYYKIPGMIDNGTYIAEGTIVVSANEISARNVDKNVSTDPGDYTTWGISKNYEMVRVTPEIAKQMGWSDTTIGMYTVHRKSPTDQYCGTTFTNHYDESDKSFKYGYNEYGTLYFTQANQGLFAIVEKTAPADGTKTGYLGNYSDRDYDYLDKEGTPSDDMQSSTTDQKNYDGSDPNTTDDSMSTVKYVHYIDLCTDTNQYATYMLTDGYKGYDEQYYSRYIEALEDGTLTNDGYDALYYEQTNPEDTIGLEKWVPIDSAFNDILNKYWDNWFSDYLTRKSGITVTRNSNKIDTWFLPNPASPTDPLKKHFIGTTINTDSFDNNDSEQSDIYYMGTYTDTNINYNTYAGEVAAMLNARSGFNAVEYLQVGNVTYDNSTAEKHARYYNTEEAVNKEQGYSFIDEREYGYIRFSKYDRDAQRYVDGDLDDSYIGGTDHADADLDGAVYSLYVDESNSFTVDYLEGEKDGKIFWAQPLNTGGYRLIWDADDAANGFTDQGLTGGSNTYTDYPHAYKGTTDGKLYLDYTNPDTAVIDVTEKQQTYKGIQHPDGLYGGAKHNGFFAVLEEQQVFIDLNNDGYAETWTLQDVTLHNGAKVASAQIKDGELYIDGLYLGTYYLAEEIRDAITIYSTDNDDTEYAENRWLSYAAGYEADTDENGNPTKYTYRFPYVSMTIGDTTYKPEQDYVHKDTNQVSYQQAVKGGSVQIHKVTSKGDSSGSNNTETEALEGAGFKVYMLSELSLIKDGTIPAAYSEEEGHELVAANNLVKLYDEAGNMVGYQFIKNYMAANGIFDYFDTKYPGGYELSDVNRIIYIRDRGYYYARDILDAYRNQFYDDKSKKWDFDSEEDAIARIYESDAARISSINADYAYVPNHLNSGSPCQYYGKNGLSEGWVETGNSVGQRNEYKLSEIFSNHYGNIRMPEMAWGAYILVETTTPVDLFTVDPMFYTVTDTSATMARSKAVTLYDKPFVASLVLIKRDAQSGQDVQQSGVTYRIWDYNRNQYVSKYLLGNNGALSMVAQRIFETDDTGRIDAVASLESGRYRIEELLGPEGYHNTFWDYGNFTVGELLGGKGADADVPTLDNMFQKYYGTVDFEITTERLYKASGIVASDNLDYIYIGENYFNDEVQGKLNIQKTGEVLVGYRNTDDIEYADEYTDASDSDFNYHKSMLRDRAVFEKMKEHYDLGTDKEDTRTVSFDITVDETYPVKYLAEDRNGMYIAAIYEQYGGELYTLAGGKVYRTGCYMTGNDGKRTTYPGAVVSTPANFYVYSIDNGTTWYPVDAVQQPDMTYKYYDHITGNEVTDTSILASLEVAVQIDTVEGNSFCAPQSMVTVVEESDNMLMIVYDLSIDTYEDVDFETPSNTFVFKVSGDIMNTAYLVTDNGDVITTSDGGVMTKKEGGGEDDFTITYTEAIYDPDRNYNYRLNLSDGTTLDVKYVTEGVYLTSKGVLVRELAAGGYSVEEDGVIKEDAKATLIPTEENTGSTFDFVYEERRLAGATYAIRAAEDIYTQDRGSDNLWFREGDIVATVTTANDGEFVSFAPVYNAGGNYDATYYYGNDWDKYTSLTQSMSYSSDQFATTGSVENHWIASRMTPMELSLYGVPAYTDSTIYPNTFYREGTERIYRRFIRMGVSTDTLVTDYQTRLEHHGGLDSEGCKVLTATNDGGFALTNTERVEYAGATLTKNGDYYTLSVTGRGGDHVEIEVEEARDTYRLTEVSDSSLPWAVGDYVTKTASGYKIVHTDISEPGINHGSSIDGAYDLGMTTTLYYPNATIVDLGSGEWELYDENLKSVGRMTNDILRTEAGGILEKTADGYAVTYTVREEFTANSYVIPSLEIAEATLTIKDDSYHLKWDSAIQKFKTTQGVIVTFAPDYSTITVDTNGTENTYQDFELLVEYDFHYAQKEDIVEVEKDGTLGTVSVNLPLGKYTVTEIATPYGFLINEKPQEVEFTYVDQIKEVVFNTKGSSVAKSQSQINVWTSKALSWFVGGVNTVGEKLYDIFNVNHYTWGTYGDAEAPYYADKNGFINTYDIRVKAWSQDKTPEKPTTPAAGDNTISKRDLVTGEELPGADLIIRDEQGNVVDAWTSTDTPHKIKNLPDGTYTLIEITSPAGYQKAEEVTFEIEGGNIVGGKVTMYDAPLDNKYTYFSKKDLTTGDELPGADLVIKDEQGNVVEEWTSTDTPHKIKDLADGTYTLTEITAPYGYEVSEEITFEVVSGKVIGGAVIMYDQPDEERHPDSEENQWKLGVGIYKADKDTGASLRGAKFGLYTTDNIYNVDGQLLVAKDTLLATATTDSTGHSNFAVDIALLSKWTDPAAKDDTLVYNHTVTKQYTDFTAQPDGTYLLVMDGSKPLTLYIRESGADVSDSYVDEEGNVLYIDAAKGTVTYEVVESIDGNTAVNTGRFYIRELTPPDGYLYDDTVYDVKFAYQDDKTMYIPVYAQHKNMPTKTTLTKYELTGKEEVPGATISVYKVKDIKDVDADGLISHEDDNLMLLDTWVSGTTAHEVTNLLLSNGEWPRLTNQELRENIYVFREEIPAAGYVSAHDIEFKLYQVQGEDGWIEQDSKEPYGYEVLARAVTCDQDYESGSIISANDHADSWFINHTATESNWDYSKVLDGYTEVKWLLVNENLVLFFADNTNPETVAKILRESDFADMEFNTVFLEFGGTAFDVDFYNDKQVAARPEDSYLTYTQMWHTLDDIHISMYDDTTKMAFTKQDIVTGEDVIGATLEIRDENGNVVDHWITEADANGDTITHYIEGVLEVNKEYTLVETMAPTEQGYVKSNSVKFMVQDDGSIQRTVMLDDFTKLEISKADITTGEEVEGAKLELWSAKADGTKIEKVDSWITGDDGYDKNGRPNRHIIDYLPVGHYVLVETMAPSGYIIAEDVEFDLTETGLLQKVQMLDATTSLKIYKYQTGTTNFVKGATIKLYSVPEQYIQYLTNNIHISSDGQVAGNRPGFTENQIPIGSSDLGYYLTGVTAKDTELRDKYSSLVSMDFSLPKDDMQAYGNTFTMELPEAIILDDSDLDKKVSVHDEDEDAFTYEFKVDAAGRYFLSVTFDSAYVAAGYDVYNVTISVHAQIADTALRSAGSLYVDFGNSVELKIPASEIKFISSSLTEEPVNIHLTDADLVGTIKTGTKEEIVSGLRPGWYIALETEAPSGYILDTTPQVFQLVAANGEQKLTFYNEKKKGGGGGGHSSKPTPETPVVPGKPLIGKLTLSINGGWWWNNLRTEDTGEDGSSIILTIEETNQIPYGKIAVVLFAVAAGCGACLVVLLKKRKKKE